MTTTEQCDEIGVIGCDYEILWDVLSDKPIIIGLLCLRDIIAMTTIPVRATAFSSSFELGRNRSKEPPIQTPVQSPRLTPLPSEIPSQTSPRVVRLKTSPRGHTLPRYRQASPG